MQISYGPLRRGLEGLLPGQLEVHILDAMWLGLLALEASMLAYAFLLQLFPKQFAKSRVMGVDGRGKKAKEL